MLEFDRRYVLIPMLIGVALVVSAFVATETGRERLVSSVQDIQTSQDRVRMLIEIQSLIADAETGQRGYVLTGDPAYLEPYEQAKQSISAYLTQVQTAYSAPDSVGMHARAAKLIELCASKLTELDTAVSLFRQSGQRGTMPLVRTNVGRELMDQLRGLVSEMRTIEGTLVLQQTEEWLRTHRVLRFISAGGSALNVVLILLAGYLVTRDIRRRTNVASGLESEVQRKSQDLSELSTHLQQVSEAEKSKLARELHDELGGLLVAIKMDLAQLRGKLDMTQPDIQKRWERIQSALASGIDLKRRVIEHLRPSLLDNMGLVAAIRWQAGEICNAAGLKLMQTYPDDEPQITGDSAIALFRIAQEALTNIAKHARASRVSIDVAITDGQLMLIIEDDGVGLTADDQGGIGSHGLQSMRHRVQPFSGHFSVERVQPNGTRIRVRIALSRIEKRPA